MSQFVPKFLSYVSAKHYLNWYTVGKVITKNKKKVNFLLRHSIVYCRPAEPIKKQVCMFSIKLN